MGLKERRKREKNERRKQILNAARSLLFDKGLKGAAVSRIAQKAELGIGTIYFYFPSKEDIYAALQNEGLELLTAEIRRICQSEKDPQKRLKRIGRAYLLFSRQNKDYFDIINYFLSAPDQVFSDDIKARIDDHGSQPLSLVTEAIDSLASLDDFRPVDARRQAILFWGTLHGVLQFRKLQKTILEGEDFDTFFDYCVQSFIDGLKKS